MSTALVRVPETRTLDDYAWALAGKVCMGCRGDLTGCPIDHYQHSGGWKVLGFEDRRWLAAKCPCGYCTSLTKLGIPGKATVEQQIVEELRLGTFNRHTWMHYPELVEKWAPKPTSRFDELQPKEVFPSALGTLVTVLPKKTNESRATIATWWSSLFR